jgi:hypothetical protein
MGADAYLLGHTLDDLEGAKAGRIIDDDHRAIRFDAGCWSTSGRRRKS